MGIVVGIFVLGLLIIVHEAGHLIAAKMCGVAVPVFSVGMGPTIWQRQFRGTDYRLALLPLGGYVMYEKGDDVDDITPWKRIWIYFAGPLANFLLALVLFALLGRPEMFGQSMVAMGRILHGLFTGQIPVSQLSGPVGIVQLASESASAGMAALAAFSAFLSLNLGVLNLLPLPVLDGGQILRALIEVATGRVLAMRLRIAMAAVTWALLLGLILYVTCADIVRLMQPGSTA